MPNSSRHSRTTAASGSSPARHLPPGNSHSPPRWPFSGRCWIYTLPPRTITASAHLVSGTGFFLLLTGNEPVFAVAKGKTTRMQRALPAQGIFRQADQGPQLHQGFVEAAGIVGRDDRAAGRNGPFPWRPAGGYRSRSPASGRRRAARCRRRPAGRGRGRCSARRRRCSPRPRAVPGSGRIRRGCGHGGSSRPAGPPATGCGPGNSSPIPPRP